MRNILLFSFFSLAFLIACEDDASSYDVREDALINYKADIIGEWSLFSIERDGASLAGHFDAALNLTISDGAFSLSSTTMPFPTLTTMVSDFSSGSWSFDDDYQPTSIQFTNGSEVVPAALSFPLYGSNNTSLGLEFSLGCSSTTYKYHFKK
jgi:hypothetical protein